MHIIRVSLFLFISLFIVFKNSGIHQQKNPVVNYNVADPDSLLGIRMMPYVVSLENFGRKEFYTWTSPAQIEELRNGKEFLSRSRSADNQPSTFEAILTDTTYNRFPMVVALRKPQFSKKRFAWSCGWPTVMGWENEKYGDQLLKITLADSAIVVGFLPYCGDTIFRYSDVNGKILNEEFVLAHQDRIGAVYFCASKKGTRTQMRGTIGKPKRRTSEINYREYVICNEKMVAKWEYATPDVKKEISGEISLLNDFEKEIKEDNYYETYYSWDIYYCGKIEVAAYATGLYNYAIAFPNDFYLMHPDRIAKISATMSAALTNQHAPISH